MKTWAVMVFLLLGAAHNALAQKNVAQETQSVFAQQNVAQGIAGVEESKTAAATAIAPRAVPASANSAAPTAAADSTAVLVAAADLSNAAVWNHGVNLREIAASRAADAEPGFAPAAAPQREGVTEDLSPLRWQVAFGPSFVRFRSSIFDASMAGTVTSVSWAKNAWLAVEGQVVTGFAPTIYDREHVKYVNYGAGVKIGTRRAKWEPYGHLLIGGAHIQPQTSGNTRNAFMIEAGGGVDYRFWSRMSFRGQLDYLRTSFFKSTQNNLQISIAAVFHF